MTFIVQHDARVHQRGLCPEAAAVADTPRSHDPGDGRALGNPR